MRPRSESRPRDAAVGRPRPGRSGFTLIELLVVMLIILLVSAVALPVVLPALSHREVSEAARILQAALVGARDAAIHANAPRGVRLLPDPTLITFTPAGQVDTTQILASNRLVAIEPAPTYTEGRVNVRPKSIFVVDYQLSLLYRDPDGGGGTWPYDGVNNVVTPVLVVEEALTTDDTFVTAGQRHSPTSWFWNVRLGDKIQIGNSGTRYTVVGPMIYGAADGNAELFVNLGPPGQQASASPLSYINQPPSLPNHEFLFLVNGHDDDGDGFIDEGWDGVDNNLDGFRDNILAPSPFVSEWENEQWLGGLSGVNGTAGNPVWNLPYTLYRRPTPSANARESTLPAGAVVDLTSWAKDKPERSRLLVDYFTGNVDIMFTPQGEVLPNTPYSSPASFRLADNYFHFWVSERSDLYSLTDFTVGGAAPQYPPYLPTPVGFNQNNTDMVLKGENRLLTLFTRNGEIVVNEIADFDPNQNDYNQQDANGLDAYDANRLFYKAQQGLRGGE